MLTLILIVLVILLISGWGGNRAAGYYSGHAPDLIWVLVVVLVLWLLFGH